MERMTDGLFVTLTTRPTMDTYDRHRAIDALDKSLRHQFTNTTIRPSLCDALDYMSPIFFYLVTPQEEAVTQLLQPAIQRGGRNRINDLRRRAKGRVEPASERSEPGV